MVFGWFKKKRPEIVQDPSQDITVLQSNLRSSFYKIKSDMQITRDWLNYFKDKDRYQDNQLKDLNSKVEEMGEVMSYMQIALERLDSNINEKKEKQLLPIKENVVVEEEEKIEAPVMNTSTSFSFDVMDQLTDTQKRLFMNALKIFKESGQEWIPIKILAEESYPNKGYGDVRSTVSEYINVLSDFNIIQKQRKGKQTYISLTERGKEMSSKITSKITPVAKKKKQ